MSMLGQQYPYYVYRDGRKTRSHFLHLLSAIRKITVLSVQDKRNVTYEVIQFPSSRIVAIAQKIRASQVRITWHTRRRP